METCPLFAPDWRGTRAHRNMATSPLCTVCNAATDTWRHSLLECNLAIAVWAMKEDDIELPLFGDETTDPKLCLFTLSNVLSQEKFIKVLVTLWAIWWARRKLIHADEHQSPLSTHMFIRDTWQSRWWLLVHQLVYPCDELMPGSLRRWEWWGSMLTVQWRGHRIKERTMQFAEMIRVNSWVHDLSHGIVLQILWFWNHLHVSRLYFWLRVRMLEGCRSPLIASMLSDK